MARRNSQRLSGVEEQHERGVCYGAVPRRGSVVAYAYAIGGCMSDGVKECKERSSHSASGKGRKASSVEGITTLVIAGRGVVRKEGRLQWPMMGQPLSPGKSFSL